MAFVSGPSQTQAQDVPGFSHGLHDALFGMSDRTPSQSCRSATQIVKWDAVSIDLRGQYQAALEHLVGGFQH